MQHTDYTLLRVSRTTHAALASAANERGMKLWVFTDYALNEFLKRDGGLE